VTQNFGLADPLVKITKGKGGGKMSVYVSCETWDPTTDILLTVHR